MKPGYLSRLRKCEHEAGTLIHFAFKFNFAVQKFYIPGDNV
jgi:hypothetical protein